MRVRRLAGDVLFCRDVRAGPARGSSPRMSRTAISPERRLPAHCRVADRVRSAKRAAKSASDSSSGAYQAVHHQAPGVGISVDGAVVAAVGGVGGGHRCPARAARGGSASDGAQSLGSPERSRAEVASPMRGTGRDHMPGL